MSGGVSVSGGVGVRLRWRRDLRGTNFWALSPCPALNAQTQVEMRGENLLDLASAPGSEGVGHARLIEADV